MKISQIPYIIFQATRRFSFKFASPFSVVKDNSSVKHCTLCTKTAHQKEIFRLFIGFIKIRQIPHVILETAIQFFFKLCVTLQFHER